MLSLLCRHLESCRHKWQNSALSLACHRRQNFITTLSPLPMGCNWGQEVTFIGTNTKTHDDMRWMYSANSCQIPSSQYVSLGVFVLVRVTNYFLSSWGTVTRYWLSSIAQWILREDLQKRKIQVRFVLHSPAIENTTSTFLLGTYLK